MKPKTEGSCGKQPKDCRYIYDHSKEELTFDGEGEMNNYTATDTTTSTPWNAKKRRN